MNQNQKINRSNEEGIITLSLYIFVACFLIFFATLKYRFPSIGFLISSCLFGCGLCIVLYYLWKKTTFSTGILIFLFLTISEKIVSINFASKGEIFFPIGFFQFLCIIFGTATLGIFLFRKKYRKMFEQQREHPI